MYANNDSVRASMGHTRFLARRKRPLWPYGWSDYIQSNGEVLREGLETRQKQSNPQTHLRWDAVVDVEGIEEVQSFHPLQQGLLDYTELIQHLMCRPSRGQMSATASR